jgi:hypothetical protein
MNMEIIYYNDVVLYRKQCDLEINLWYLRSSFKYDYLKISKRSETPQTTRTAVVSIQLGF